MTRARRQSTGEADAYLGSRLRARRHELSATQEQVAAMMNHLGFKKWQPATVAAIETGQRNIKLTELGTLCQILGTSLRFLIGEDAPDPLPILRPRPIEQ